MGVEKAKTSLGMIEEDDSDNVYNRGNKTFTVLHNSTHSEKTRPHRKSASKC